MSMRFLKRAAVAAFLLGAASAASAATIVVGGKNYTEQQLMSEMTAQLLKAKGFDGRQARRSRHRTAAPGAGERPDRRVLGNIPVPR